MDFLTSSSDTHQTVNVRQDLILSLFTQGDESAPAVVFLPGPTDSWRSYESVLDALPHSIWAIAVSQRGHGDSDKPVSGYRVEDFGSDVVALLDALGIERTVLVGHSGSCLVVRHVAIHHPQRVAGLVLEASPSTLVGDAGFQKFVYSVISGLADPIDANFARSFVVDTSSSDLAPEVVDRFVDELLKVPARVWLQTFRGLLDYDDLDHLGQITAPTLLIWGNDDRLVLRQMQDDLQAAIPKADLHVYPGAGHTPRWDDPIRFASDVVAFVEQLAQGEGS